MKTVYLLWAEIKKQRKEKKRGFELDREEEGTNIVHRTANRVSDSTASKNN